MLFKELIYSERLFIFFLGTVVLCLFGTAGFISTSVLLFCLFCFINGDFSVAQVKEKVILLLPILLACFYLIRIPANYNLTDYLAIVERKSFIFLLPLSFLVLKKKISSKAIELISISFIFGCILCSLICYYFAIANIVSSNAYSVVTDDRREFLFSYYQLVSPIDFDPIYISLYCNVAVILTFHVRLLSNRLTKGLVLVYLVIFIFLISAKIGIIGLVMIAVIKLLLELKGSYIRLLFVFFVFAAALFALWRFEFLSERFITSTKFDFEEPYGHKWNSTTIRLAIWTGAMEAIKEKPIFGYGTGCGQAGLEEAFTRNRFSWGLMKHYNAHSQFLSTQLDLGMFGTLLLLFVLLFPLKMAAKIKHSSGLCFSLIIILFCSVESILLRQKGIVLFSFFYSIIWLMPFKKTSDEI